MRSPTPEEVVEERELEQQELAGVVGSPVARAVRLSLLVGAVVLLGVSRGVPALLVVGSVVLMIFLHELGHYIAAKRAGMKEFGAVTFSGASGIAMSGELIFTPLVDMGGLQVANIPLVIADAHVFDVWRLKNEPALLVGMDVLGQARAMAIDYRRGEMELVLDPANATAARRKR